uniref:EF-hand and coiled-coil domain containing 1 n=1 Tax=Oryzias latipes TaxID=8090 RepID=A0A3B3I8N8_ORYLA
MDAADCSDPYGRPARRTQWIVSTLAYHYGLDRGVENEIIVLATGLDQYLQEIFHHLDYRGAGRIPVGDFSALCEVLGLKQDQECAGVLEGLPGEISFRLFHARLCGYFSSKAGCGYENGRLLVGEDSEHIETQIRLRTPLKRREKLLSRHAPGCRLGSYRIGKLEDENASLRELIEDMRAALQSSDARCLALQVGNRQSSGQRLEQELWSSRETVVALQREQLSMRKKVEEARQALRISLGKVKDLEVKARDVPALQRYILQLKSEIGSQTFYLVPPFGDGKMFTPPPPPPTHTHSEKPVYIMMMCFGAVEEQLFRSVEGQAASDEEEEKWSDHQQRQVDEVKRILTRLSSCSEGYGSSSSSTIKELERLVQELQQKAEETGLLQAELHMLETGKVRLSLLEEKLGDILQFLHELRDLDISRRSLGKILVSTLESGSDPQHSQCEHEAVGYSMIPHHHHSLCSVSTQAKLTSWRCSTLSVMNWLHVNFCLQEAHSSQPQTSKLSSSPAKQYCSKKSNIRLMDVNGVLYCSSYKCEVINCN